MGRPHRRKKRKGKLLPITSLGSICISTGYSQQYQDTWKRTLLAWIWGIWDPSGVNERCKVYLGTLTPCGTLGDPSPGRNLYRLTHQL